MTRLAEYRAAWRLARRLEAALGDVLPDAYCVCVVEAGAVMLDARGKMGDGRGVLIECRADGGATLYVTGRVSDTGNGWCRRVADAMDLVNDVTRTALRRCGEED